MIAKMAIMMNVAVVMMPSTHPMQTPFDYQGHRGCRGLEPENTWPAFKKALDLGVVTLEMDVVISKDSQVVVSHDPFFNHEITTKPDGTFISAEEEQQYRMYGMDYSDIRRFDVGLKPHPRFPKQEKVAAFKPRLADLLDQVHQYMLTSRRPLPYFNIETKTTAATDNKMHPPPAAFVELLMAVIKEKGVEDRVIIQSFDFRTLQYLHVHYPQMKTAMLIEDFDKRGLAEQLKALGFKPDIYSPEQSLVNPALIADCHAQGIKVIPWTVNEKASINQFRDMGVDGIISDYPDLFK